MYDKLDVMLQEVISREVLVDEGSRQVVELEQAAIWRFLWWSGTISVHVLVDQNREDHSVRTQYLLLLCVCVLLGKIEGVGGQFLLQPTNLIFIRHEDLKNFLLWLHLVVRKLMEKEFYNSLV